MHADQVMWERRERLQKNGRVCANMGRRSLDCKLMDMVRVFLKSLRSRAVGNSPFQAVESRQTSPPNAQTRRILTAFFSFETRKHLQHAFGLPSLLRPVNLAPDCAVQAGQQSINLWRLAHVRSVQIQDE